MINQLSHLKSERFMRAASDMPKAVSGHGFCTTVLAIEPEQASPHGISPLRSQLHTGRSTRVARLSNLFRLCRSFDPARSQALLGR
jgi:hypothetical protein